jgi:hypothetical protein
VKIGQLNNRCNKDDSKTGKYMIRTAGYIWADHKTNKNVAKELNITPVLDKIQDYKRK